MKSRDQIGKYGSKTLLLYYQNQFGDRGSYEFRSLFVTFAAAIHSYDHINMHIHIYLLYIHRIHMNLLDVHNGPLRKVSQAMQLSATFYASRYFPAHIYKDPSIEDNSIVRAYEYE